MMYNKMFEGQLSFVIAISSWLLWRNKQKHYVLLHQAQESKW
jgi:hypothetical protein